MEALLLGFKVVFPIIVYISIGYFLKLIKFYDEKGVKTINSIVFKLFLPCLLFYNVYSTDIAEILDMKLILYAVSAIVILFLLLMLIVPRIIKENGRRGVFIQGVFRSNFALFGVPISESILGEGGSGLTSFAVAFIVPLYNILAVICLESFRKSKINILSILKGIITNPLIISSLLGVIFVAFNIKLPDMCTTVVRDLSRVATPLALVGLGGSLNFSSVKNNASSLSAILILKLAIIPAVALTVAYMLGFSGAPIVTLISVFATPTAVSSFTMAQSMGGDSDLAAQTVVFTSVLSILSVFLVVIITKSLGLY